jgi:hypothetical protein
LDADSKRPQATPAPGNHLPLSASL